MNKIITSVLAVGAGVAAYSYGKRNQRQMKKLKRGIKGIF
jgi:hypothetical protein